MALLEFSDRLPQCSRCRGDLFMCGVAPQDDEYGRPIHMELCPSCDSGDVNRPAAGLFVQFFADCGGHDPARMREAAHLMTEWTKECMAVHGWYLRDTPPDQF
ncbi:DUF6300 family protein [Streptomyces aureocirculatus]|uniref:DUF6300 family protein n=1 Tax=Streptomyces aureocirculatus TaxID=67275 RepID=UPI0004C6FE93|nr:DUF6300 family protein [Streptomyces aureocirculatus]